MTHLSNESLQRRSTPYFHPVSCCSLKGKGHGDFDVGANSEKTCRQARHSNWRWLKCTHIPFVSLVPAWVAIKMRPYLRLPKWLFSSFLLRLTHFGVVTFFMRSSDDIVFDNREPWIILKHLDLHGFSTAFQFCLAAFMTTGWIGC